MHVITGMTFYGRILCTPIKHMSVQIKGTVTPYTVSSATLLLTLLCGYQSLHNSGHTYTHDAKESRTHEQAAPRWNRYVHEAHMGQAGPGRGSDVSGP